MGALFKQSLVGGSIPTVLLVTPLVFHAAPGDPAEIFFWVKIAAHPNCLLWCGTKWGSTDRSMQFLSYMGNILRGF